MSGELMKEDISKFEVSSQQMTNRFEQHVSSLPTAGSSPEVTATIRRHYSDFQVTEQLSFHPSGEGEHLFLYVEKNRCNSEWVANQLQRHFKLRSQDIGYAGKKDRYSISRQWFSLHIPGKEVSSESIDNIENEFFRVITVARHNKKLRRGAISQNRFQIKVSDVSGEISESAVKRLVKNGFPNYFGYQRFGHRANNLVKVEQLFNGEIKCRSRNKRGLYLSAARSFLFNLMVAERIKGGSWNHVIKGDCLSLSGSRSYFVCDNVDDDIERRVDSGDLHVSGWLAGKEPSQAKEKALVIENHVIENYSHWLEGLAKAGLASDRRPMRVIPDDFEMKAGEGNEFWLYFSLPAGSFATSLLRELFVVNDEATERITNHDS